MRIINTLWILALSTALSNCRAHDIGFVQRNAVAKDAKPATDATSSASTIPAATSASEAKLTDGSQLSNSSGSLFQVPDLPEMPKDPQAALVAILISRNTAGLSKEQQKDFDERFNEAVEASHDNQRAEITADEWKYVLGPISRAVVEAAIKDAPTKWAEWRKKNSKKIEDWIGGLKSLVKGKDYIKADPYARCNYLSKFYTKNSSKMQVYFLLTQDELKYESNVIRTCGIISFPEECPACERKFMVNIISRIDRNLYEATVFNERCLVEADKNTEEISSNGAVRMTLALVGSRSVPMRNGFQGRFRVFREVNPDIADVIDARVKMLDQELRRRHTYWPDVAH